MAEPRRVRTQAERAADDHAWRQTAQSRPGYATWPNSTPGSPSWWRRYGEPENHHHGPSRPPHLGPPPVDGETCAVWCGFCHLGTGAKPPTTEEMETAVREALATGQPAVLPNGSVIHPRRRWWHRYTRRSL